LGDGLLLSATHAALPQYRSKDWGVNIRTPRSVYKREAICSCIGGIPVKIALRRKKTRHPKRRATWESEMGGHEPC
jgi:hypothetical protein